MYLVTEIHDRELIQFLPAETRGDASRIANELLEAHCGVIRRPEEYKRYAAPDLPDKWPPAMSLARPEDGEMDSWCNLENTHFDAHAAYVPDGTACDMLGMLLKQLCRTVKDQNDADVCNGRCDSCPVTLALQMAERARKVSEAERTAAAGKDGPHGGV